MTLRCQSLKKLVIKLFSDIITISVIRIKDILIHFVIIIIICIYLVFF
jgi:hypothetical protein